MANILYILCYADGKVYKIYADDEDREKTIESLLADYGFDIDEADFMWSNVDTDIIETAYKVR